VLAQGNLKRKAKDRTRIGFWLVPDGGDFGSWGVSPQGSRFTAFDARGARCISPVPARPLGWLCGANFARYCCVMGNGNAGSVFSCALVLAISACGGGSQEPATQDQSGDGSEMPAPMDCPDQTETAKVHARYLEGKELIASCGEACMKSEGGGQDRNRGLALVREAADSGDLEAQSLYGRVLFGDLMTTGQEESLRDQYIEAIYFLRLATRRGDAATIAFMPDLEKVRAMPTGFYPPLPPPLSDLDEDWVRAGIQKADRARVCPQRDP
jgi:hypothetical protein